MLYFGRSVHSIAYVGWVWNESGLGVSCIAQGCGTSTIGAARSKPLAHMTPFVLQSKLFGYGALDD